MKTGTAIGLGGCATEGLESGGGTVTDWSARLLKLYFFISYIATWLGECMCGVPSEY